MLRLTTLLLCCLSFHHASSCSCFWERKASVEALLYDGLVFTGNITAVDTVYGEHKNYKYPHEFMATFKVVSWISGREVSDTVTVYTSAEESDCGLPFEAGQTWLIYAHEFEGIQSSSICTPSMRMEGRNDELFHQTVAYLKKLKSTTGYIQEKDEWTYGPYLVSGNLKKGKPVGQWLRVREKDTIAIFHFNDDGKRHGYQMEKNEDYDATITSYREVTDSTVSTFDFDKNTLLRFYELKNGLRHGRFEIYGSEGLSLNATYVNGHLHGELVTWHRDTAIAKGKIKTVKVFDKDKLISSARFDEAGNVIER